MSVAEIVEKWKSGAKQVDIANDMGVSEAYISQVLSPYKKIKMVESFGSHSIYVPPDMPEGVKIAWDQVSKSIESAWGKIQIEGPNKGKRKWPSKYGHFLILKNWIEKQL